MRSFIFVMSASAQDGARYEASGNTRSSQTVRLGKEDMHLDSSVEDTEAIVFLETERRRILETGDRTRSLSLWR